MNSSHKPAEKERSLVGVSAANSNSWGR